MKKIDSVLDQQYLEEKADYEMFMAASKSAYATDYFWWAGGLFISVLLFLHWLLGIGW
jgi:hypothetical protein